VNGTFSGESAASSVVLIAWKLRCRLRQSIRGCPYTLSPFTLSPVTLSRSLCPLVTLSPVTLSPGHFVPGHFVPGHFVPWSLCLPVNLSSSHIVPRSLAQDKKDRDAFTNSTTVKPLCQGSPGRRQNLALHFLFGQI
jgi:hypothetical protein